MDEALAPATATSPSTRDLIRDLDWASTPIGPPSTWPRTLRQAVDMIMPSAVPMVVLWGRQGVLVYNDAYAAMAGQRHPSAFGRAAAEAWPEVAAWNNAVIEQGLAGRTLSFRNQPMRLDRNGKPEDAWFNLDYSPLMGDDGQPAGLLAICADTTEQVRTQERLRIAQEAGGVGTFEWYPKTGALDVSDEYRRIWGLPPGATITDEELVARLHPEDRDQAAPNRLGESNPLGYTEYRARVDGEERWIARRGEVVLSGEGRDPRYVGVVFDVTERKRVEMALRASEGRQRFLVELGDRLRAIAEPEEVMATAAEMLGRHLQAGRVGYGEIAGTPSYVEVSRDWTDGRMASFAGRHRLSDFGPVVVGELEAGRTLVIEDISADDRAVQPEIRAAFSSIGLQSAVAVPLVKGGRFAAALYVHDTHPRHWSTDEVALVADVADRTWEAVDRARITRELLEFAATLEQRVGDEVRRRSEAEEQLRQAVKMEALGQLTGGLAHDFNNLLTGIIGGLDVVRRRLASGRTDEVGRYMDMTVASAQRAATLTHRLLAFSRRQALDTQAVDVNGVVRSMEELLRRTLGENIVLETALAQDLGPARTDSHQLESALLNLVINARDAMPSGGRLVIETAAEPGPHDPHAEAGSGPVVILRVRDTGVGMSPGVVARAFDPFFTTKPIGAGTGLGLSMVYGFVRQSNGEIRITSIEGRGTTVSMMLPRDIGAADAVVSAPLAETPEGSGESVLVVEDDPGVRMLALDVLNDVGYRTLVAENAEQALAILRSGERIDLLLTDVGLPGLNGRQLAEIARQRRPGLSVLFMTGYAEIAGSHPSFLDQGMGMIVKPFDVDSLATRVREVIGSRPAHMGAA